MGNTAAERSLCLSSPEQAIDYAEKWGWGEWPMLRSQLMGRGWYQLYIRYLGRIEKKRDPELEERLLSPEPERDRRYYQVGLGDGRFIDKDELGTSYAVEVLKCRWPGLERRLLTEASQEATPLLPLGVRKERHYFYQSQSISYFQSQSIPYFPRLPDGPRHYILQAVKGRWPELEGVILGRYGRFPLRWEDNQEFLLGYLRALADRSGMDADEAEKAGGDALPG